MARGGVAPHPVVISATASPETKAAAEELAAYLGKISGGTFKVETGDGSKGIVVGLPGDLARLPFETKFDGGPFGREEYLLRSSKDALHLLGATDLAVSHAVWDVLHRLGHRQFFPGETWEAIPSAKDLSIEVDVRERPAFLARRIWYNWGLWGYNNEPYRQWNRRNRMAKGFDLDSGHSYEGIIGSNKAEFDKHPEYLALVKGERKMRGDVKFCVSNPGLRKLVAEHAVRTFKKRPQLDSISMDPSDGGNWCECEECAKFASVSDRVLTLANEVAVAINEIGLGPKYVGMYAYNQHSSPPTIRVHPNVIPSATTAFIGGGFTFDQVVTGWQAKGATLGTYDYLSVVDWDWNLPRGSSGARPLHLAEFIPKIHQMGVRFYDAESGDCWGPCGLGYYFASRALWDVKEAERYEAIREDFLRKAFASAYEPMKGFYQLINEDTQRRPPGDIVGRMYRFLDTARKATDDPRVRERIDHLILYTRHAELYYAHANGGGVSKEDVARHAYRIRKTMMVHSYGLWARLVGQKAAHEKDHPLKVETPYSAEEVSKFLSEGITKHQPVEPGFSSIEFSTNLVPAAGRLKLSTPAAGKFPDRPQDRQSYWIWVEQGAGAVELKITVEKVWANRMPKLSLYSPAEVSLDPVAVFDAYRPDGKEVAARMATPHAGLHRVETVDGGDVTKIAWPAGMPVTVESGPETPTVSSHFRGSWTMYVYVPKGTKTVGGWAARVANWAPRVSGKLLDGDGNEVFDFGKMAGDGFFNVAVPPGQDGRLWRFEKNVGQRLLMTVPPYLARSAEELMLPVEVIEKDK